MITRTPAPPVTEEDRIRRYGYRLVKRELPDGQIEFDYRGLTLDDLLHPQFGDFAVISSVHDLETTYLTSVFRSRLADDPGSLVLHDCAIFWDVPPLRHHSPDVSVIFNVREQRFNWPSFNVEEEGTRPTLIIEDVSPDYRVNDVVTKVQHYHLARVPFYFIIDRVTLDDSPSLLGYRWTPQEYVPLSPNDDGRFWLDSLRLWLGVEDGKVACFDGDTGERLGDYTEVSRALAEANQRAETEARRAETETRRADEQQQRADLEHRQRLDTEAQLQALQAEIRKLRGEG